MAHDINVGFSKFLTKLIYQMEFEKKKRHICQLENYKSRTGLTIWYPVLYACLADALVAYTEWDEKTGYN